VCAQLSNARTFTFHADLEAFRQSAVLALVAMVLVDWTVSRATARVRQVATHRALEEALAALARRLPVVFARTLVPAHHALDAARRYRKSADDVTAVTASTAAHAVASGNGHLLAAM